MGLPGTDLGQTDEGAAYVYYGGPSGIPTTPDVIIQSNVATAQLGFSVSTAGDVNGDGYSDLAVGAWRWQSTGAELREGACSFTTVRPQDLGHTGCDPSDRPRRGFHGRERGLCRGRERRWVQRHHRGWPRGELWTDGGRRRVHFPGGPAGISTTYANRLERNRSFTQFGRACGRSRGPERRWVQRCGGGCAQLQQCGDG